MEQAAVRLAATDRPSVARCEGCERAVPAADVRLVVAEGALPRLCPPCAEEQETRQVWVQRGCAE